MKKTIVCAAIAVIGLAGWGCGEHDLLTSSSFVSLSLNPDSTTLLAIGESPRLALGAKDFAGNAVSPRLVRWVSNDPATVEVRQDGTIVALRDGTATILAYVGGAVPAKMTVTVDATVEMTAEITAISTRPVKPVRDSANMVVYDKGVSALLRK